MLKRRLVYVTLIIIWLVIMILPIVAMAVAVRGELTVGGKTRSHLRTFLVQGDETNGLGLEWSRRSGEDKSCQKISLRYLLWEGDSSGVNTNYCQCIDKQGGQVQFVDSC